MGNFGCCSYQSQNQENNDAPIVPTPKFEEELPFEEKGEFTDSEKSKKTPEKIEEKVEESKENNDFEEDKTLHHRSSTKKQTEIMKLPMPITKSKKDSIHFHRGSFVHTTKGDVMSMYSVVGTIGKGSFGRVHKVKHKITGDIRAVKVLMKEKISDSSRATIISEVEILKALDHPNILKVFEVYEDSNQISIVTELCQGGELFDRIIAHKRFSESIAANYMYQIMSGVLACHEKGIMHRDLKPENIMFLENKEDSNIKIIEFGTSTKIDSGSILNIVTGTVIII